MALQTSGQISLNDIHIEAGGSSGSQASLNDTDIRSLIGKSSGAQMSFSEWYGASAGPSPSTISGFTPSNTAETGSTADFGYLKGTNDTVVMGSVYGQPMKYYTFGTNNRLSTWGSTPSFVDFPGMRYTTGNRAFNIGVVEGSQRFVVPTENWLGYTTGLYMKVYEANGSSGVTGKSSWSYAYSNQAVVAGIFMDPFNPRNGVMLVEYLHNVSNYNDIHAFFFQVSSDGTSMSIQSYQRLTSGGTSNPYSIIDAIYRNGRLVIYCRRNTTYSYVVTAQANTSTGHMSSVGSPTLLNSNQYTYASEYTNQCLFYLNNQFVLLNVTESGGTKFRLTRLAFSGNSVTFNNHTTVGLSEVGGRYHNRYVIGENTNSSNDSVFLAHYSSSSDFSEEVWKLSGSTFSKEWENTTEADTIYKTINNGYQSGYGYMGHHRTYQGTHRPNHATYTKDDKVLRQCKAYNSSGSQYSQNPLIMPWYWSH